MVRLSVAKGRRRWVLVAALVVLVAVAGGGAVWLFRDRGPAPEPVARNVSHNYRACLLVPAGAAARDSVDAVWRGLQRAAATGKVNAQRYPVPSTDVPAALPYVNGAVAQHCDVLVAVGPSLVPVLRVVATGGQAILLVNGSGLAGGNVTVLSAARPDAVTAQTRSWVLGRAGR